MSGCWRRRILYWFPDAEEKLAMPRQYTLTLGKAYQEAKQIRFPISTQDIGQGVRDPADKSLSKECSNIERGVFFHPFWFRNADRQPYRCTPEIFCQLTNQRACHPEDLRLGA